MASERIATSSGQPRRRRLIPQKKWNTIKEPFILHYVTKDKSLTESMNIMLQEYGFEAQPWQYVRQIKNYWHLPKYSKRPESNSRKRKTDAQDELRKQLSPSQSDGAYAHTQHAGPNYVAVPSIFNDQSGYSSTGNLNQGSQPLQYAINASQANNEPSWSYNGNSGSPVQQDPHAPSQMYTGTYAYGQSSLDLFQREPAVLTTPYATQQSRFQVPHASNPETSGTIFQPGFPYAYNGAELGPAGTSAEICREWQGLGPVGLPDTLPSHNYNEEYDYEDEDEEDEEDEEEEEEEDYDDEEDEDKNHNDNNDDMEGHPAS